jgi:hypothetical protein
MKAGEKLIEGVAPHLEAGERALAAIVAASRGNTAAVAGGGIVVRELGNQHKRKQFDAAAEASLVLASPMGLVVTNQRLLTLKISAPLPLGKGGDVKELLSAVPLSAVEEIKVKRLLVGKTLTLTVAGQTFKLEAGAGADANGLVAAFEEARGGVAV